jgi:glucose-6-phosphate isomerase
LEIETSIGWGVALGKLLAGRTVSQFASGAQPEPDHEDSTNNLVRRYRAHRGGG